MMSSTREEREAALTEALGRTLQEHRIGDIAFAEALKRLLVAVNAWTDRDEARAAIERVRRLHQPFTDDGVKYCGWNRTDGGCGQAWPCATIRALNGGDSDDA